jgi:hypothetical protein
MKRRGVRWTSGTALVVLLLLVLGSTTAVAEPTDQSLTIDSIGTNDSNPSVDRLDNETWLVPKEAVPVYVSGTTAREDETVVTLQVVRDNKTIDVGEATAEDGRWNTTVDLTDVQTGTHTLRVTDGRATTTVQIELVHVLRPPSTTPTETTGTPTPEETTSVPSIERGTPTERHAATTATTSTNAPGFTLGISVAGLLIGTGLFGR